MRVSASTMRVFVAFSMVNLVLPLCACRGQRVKRNAPCTQSRSQDGCRCWHNLRVGRITAQLLHHSTLKPACAEGVMTSATPSFKLDTCTQVKLGAIEQVQIYTSQIEAEAEADAGWQGTGLTLPARRPMHRDRCSPLKVCAGTSESVGAYAASAPSRHAAEGLGHMHARSVHCNAAQQQSIGAQKP